MNAGLVDTGLLGALARGRPTPALLLRRVQPPSPRGMHTKGSLCPAATEPRWTFRGTVGQVAPRTAPVMSCGNPTGGVWPITEAVSGTDQTI